ncbi:uncharacterized protein PGTG_14415 [Puccinia graminis f. sp. tritici CRL 75-36-700-3]|uniref:Uncharacterized protein n=1 Tax=Puccinia graminis f. sp. tritici (strain CRL 75-36-700-3 / race SCCL) TaxID=418459 RepID=E3KVJ1_PUCGT|nr:uncharacterized protein PGTG_14415 [Puccinia graminis f. sp. tritici CRL 75-36-700-3]EFP88331.2 hypothetical protein PGTG_14415 [Puccinia graminis f. sp. tritici CRL 75-36-700-3]
MAPNGLAIIDIRPVQEKGLMLFDPPTPVITGVPVQVHIKKFSRTLKAAATPEGIITQPHHRPISLTMIPKTILFVIFMAITSVATGTYVVCANESCDNTNASQMYSHPYPKEAKCGEPLGNEECQEIRLKTYYLCGKCGSTTVKNRVIHRGDSAPCPHKGKALFSRPGDPPPPGPASHSGATSSVQASSSEGGLPYEIIDGRKFYKFV